MCAPRSWRRQEQGGRRAGRGGRFAGGGAPPEGGDGRGEMVLGEEGKGERGRPQRRARSAGITRGRRSGESAGASGSVGGVEVRRGHREALRAVGGVESPTHSESLRRTIFSKIFSTIARGSKRTQFILLRQGLKTCVDSCGRRSASVVSKMPPTVSQRDPTRSVLIFISKLQFVLGCSRLWKLIASPSSRNTFTSVKHIFVFFFFQNGP